MKSMKLSAIVLGLATASALAQAAPANAAEAAAQPAAQPVAEAPAAEPAVAPAAQPADESPAKAEEAQPAAAPATEPTAEPAAVAAPKAEETKVEEKPKAEEPKKEEAKAEEPKTEEKKEEVAKVEEAAAPSFTERLNITKADEAPEAKKAMEFKISGQAEFDAYGYWKNDDKKELTHDYWSTVDVDFNVKFNEKWSAFVELEADADNEAPGVHYNGAFVQYTKNENFAIKFGDLTYSEGAFNYYDYNDPADNAAGMAEHDIRGIELDLYGLQLGLGFGRGVNDLYVSCTTASDEDGDLTPNCYTSTGKSYDAHVAYQFDFAGQALRPFAHYKSWQEPNENELHAGLEAALEFGPFAVHSVYGLHMDRLNKNQPDASHAFLIEPTFKVANVSIKGGFYYLYLADGWPTIHYPEMPEYMFAYGEGDIKLTDAVTIGLLGELHTNSLEDDTDLGSLNFGTRIYFSPVDGLDVTGFAMAILPMGDDWEKAGHEAFVTTRDYGEDLNLYFGVETVFSF